MVAHVINSSWDSTMLPATLSEKAINVILCGQLGFKGLVFSDDMQMKAIADHYGLEPAIVLAVNAGVDVLMFANTLPDSGHCVTATQIQTIIRKLVLNKNVPQIRIDEAYRRICTYKAKHEVIAGF